MGKGVILVTNPKLEEIWREIVGFYPVYSSDGGNNTLILLHDGQQYTDKRKTKTVLQAIARIFAADLTALRQRYRGYLGRKGLVPLPLHKDLILLPIRVRRVQYKDHGATGYLVLRQIVRVAPDEAASQNGTLSRITLKGGVSIKCMEKPATVRKRLTEGAQVREEYERFCSGRTFLPGSEFVRDPLIAEEGTVIYHIHLEGGVVPHCK